MVKKIQASVHYFSFFQQMMIAHFIFSANDEKCFLFNHILNGFFRGSFWGGGGGGGGTPCQICYDQARNLKFGTYVHTHMQFQKIYLLASKPS